MAVTMKSVFSSNVNEIGYDPDTSDLYVRWNGGKTSVYSGVPPEIAADASTAYSVGQYLNEHVKPVYPHRYV